MGQRGESSARDPDELTIVIPTLNEAEAIGHVIDELRALGYTNLLVVDGRSTDGTPEVAKRKGARVIFQEGAGKADAIRTAVRHVRTPYVLVMDGDLTYDPSFIRAMLELAKQTGAGEVIGARLWGRENIPLLNRLGNWLITMAFNILFGTKLRDVCSGMWLARTEALKKMPYESKGFSIEVEVVASVISASGRVLELPIRYRPRLGRAKLKPFHGFLILLTILRMGLRWRLRKIFGRG